MIGLKKMIVAGLISAATTVQAGSGDFIVDGNLGVGTTTPTQKLDVNGILRVKNSAFDAADFLFKPNTTPKVPLGGSTTASIITTSGTSAGSFHVGFEIPSNDPSDGFFVSTDSNQDGIVDTIALRILANGNVGIGAIAPKSKLDVIGTVNFGLRQNGGAQPGFLGNTWTQNEHYKYATLGSSYFDGTNWITNGNAGFGSSHVVMMGLDADGIKFYLQPSIGNTQRNESTTTFDTYEKVRIDKNGKVGIGTQTPTQQMEVNGGVRLNTASAKPACDTNAAGTIWYENGTTDDSLLVCAKKNNVYAWKQIW